MAVRAGMENLILRLRRLIGDVERVVNGVTVTEQYTDQELQDALDEQREQVHHLELRMEPTLGSPIYYLTYYAPVGDWEEDVVLKNGAYTTVTPDTSDYIAGRWTFTTEPDYPIFLVGKTYDLYATAADTLERWSSLKSDVFDFSSNDQSFKFGRAFDGRQGLASRYRQRARVKCALQVRGDIASDGDRSAYERVLRSYQ